MPDFPAYRYIASVNGDVYYLYSDYILTKQGDNYYLYCSMKSSKNNTKFSVVHLGSSYTIQRSGSFTSYKDAEGTRAESTHDTGTDLYRFMYNKTSNTWEVGEDATVNPTSNEIVIQSTLPISDGDGVLVQYPEAKADENITITMDREYFEDKR